MTVYVDFAIWKKSPKGKKSYAHLTADSLDELHAFAAAIGIKSHFFHKARAGWHYDIDSDQQKIAITAGAVLVSSKEILKRAKNLIPVE